MTRIEMAQTLNDLRGIDTHVRKSPALMKTAGDRQIRRVRPLILKDAALSKRQGPLPFIWSHNPDAQARARAWVFANLVDNSGALGGRYQRTGRMEKATKVSGAFTQDGGSVTLSNDAPGSERVFGALQIPGHAAAGHPTFASVADKWAPLLQTRYSETWLTIADPLSATRG